MARAGHKTERPVEETSDAEHAEAAEAAEDDAQPILGGLWILGELCV